eukprot:gnl/MRDRNA2_/MRDRNA2_80519_c0_seq1.p1 gnl/MRDRNA2_/MRDRNA2_80519_c0~~gnl/MRDRNA2_/MRDRNA2_80519_c0_seq1.p1  ORF type:complete len:472 (-),score=52.85 gnl/MRDRNA2_/MRDRNA2_80519_c0_seq1:242-1657(-)
MVGQIIWKPSQLQESRRKWSQVESQRIAFFRKSRHNILASQLNYDPFCTNIEYDTITLARSIMKHIHEASRDYVLRTLQDLGGRFNEVPLGWQGRFWRKRVRETTSGWFRSSPPYMPPVKVIEHVRAHNSNWVLELWRGKAYYVHLETGCWEKANPRDTEDNVCQFIARFLHHRPQVIMDVLSSAWWCPDETRNPGMRNVLSKAELLQQLAMLIGLPRLQSGSANRLTPDLPDEVISLICEFMDVRSIQSIMARINTVLRLRDGMDLCTCQPNSMLMDILRQRWGQWLCGKVLQRRFVEHEYTPCGGVLVESKSAIHTLSLSAKGIFRYKVIFQDVADDAFEHFFSSGSWIVKSHDGAQHFALVLKGSSRLTFWKDGRPSSDGRVGPMMSRISRRSCNEFEMSLEPEDLFSFKIVGRQDSESSAFTDLQNLVCARCAGYQKGGGELTSGECLCNRCRMDLQDTTLGSEACS